MTWNRTRNSGIKPTKVSAWGFDFDSIFESEVYYELAKRYGQKNVEVHYPIPLKPATEVFKELSWAVDFKVNDNGRIIYYEAKGLMDEVFRLKIQLLEWAKPEIYDNLFIVCTQKQRLTISRKTKLRLTEVITKKQIKTHPNFTENQHE